MFADTGAGAHNSLYAVDAETGQARWEFSVDRGTATSDPAVGDGVVYLGTRPDGVLHAVDARTGKPRWEFSVGGGDISRPAVANGIVCVISSSDDGDFDLYMVDAETGRKRHEVPLPDIGYGASSPRLSEGKAYVGNGNTGSSARPYVVDTATGKKRSNLPKVNGSPTALADGVLYFGGRRLRAVDAMTGKQKWELFAEDGTSTYGNPEVAEGTLYVSRGGGAENGLCAMDPATGKRLWTFHTGHGNFSPLSLSRGLVRFTNTSGASLSMRYELHVLEAGTGKQRWKYSSGVRLANPLAVGGVV
ncbi:PQQ-binding-like beta-propeller repeat protein [Streptomyces sp. NPDC058739]|uniref:outer membrane protein assembly factor BamB family protein n=1 Tax=Streptomyces sp. NPDC058739 TaxID=3346618 RepID=UPI0036CC6703